MEFVTSTDSELVLPPPHIFIITKHCDVHVVAVGHTARWIFMEKLHLAEQFKKRYVGRGGHIPMHMFIGGLGTVKVDCKLLYMHYSGSIQLPNRLPSSPGSQYAKSIPEPDIQGMKLLCEVMERTVN